MKSKYVRQRLQASLPLDLTTVRLLHGEGSYESRVACEDQDSVSNGPAFRQNFRSNGTSPLGSCLPKHLLLAPLHFPFPLSLPITVPCS